MTRARPKEISDSDLRYEKQNQDDRQEKVKNFEFSFVFHRSLPFCPLMECVLFTD